MACACLWWVTRAAQQAMEVAQVECGCFFGWLGFFLLFMCKQWIAPNMTSIPSSSLG